MRYYHTFISVIFAVLFCALLGCGGGDTNEMPLSPIFDDVEPIDDVQADGTKFTYYLPPEVAYAVLGVFSPTISEEYFIGGSQTGLPGFGRGQVLRADLYTYDQSTNRFNTTSFTPSSGQRWAVWGYDKWGNLTHASGDLDVP